MAQYILLENLLSHCTFILGKSPRCSNKFRTVLFIFDLVNEKQFKIKQTKEVLQ